MPTVWSELVPRSAGVCCADEVPGASSATVRVTNVNANYAAADGGGVFELLLVTEDGERHTVTPTAVEATALFAMVQASPVLLWDPESRTLIAANIVGDWLPLDWTAAR